MVITLKNVRHNERLSHETLCFSADIFINGKKAGYAENAGHGGSTNIQPRACREQIDAFAKTLPPEATNLPDHKDPTKKWEFQPTADTIIDRLVEDELRTKTVRRVLNQRVLFTKPGQKGIFQTGVIKGGKKNLDGVVETYRTKLLGTQIEKILNLLPIEEAVAIYFAKGGEKD